MDIFPFSEKPPEPMRVDPPLPVDQELRVIVFEVTNVETIQEIDPGPGMEKLNDLLVQGHFSGDTESQVHLLSLAGLVWCKRVINYLDLVISRTLWDTDNQLIDVKT